MAHSVNSISIFSNIFIAPQKAFKDIQYRYPIVLPLLLNMLFSAGLFLLLFTNIDFEWYVDHMVEISAGDKSKSEQDQARQLLEMLSPTMTGISSGISAAIATAIIFCGFAIYYVFISSINNDGFEFSQWFSFVCWTSVPMLIGILASIMMILFSTTGQIALESLDPLSLNQLFFRLDPTQGLGEILASTNILTFWTIGLMAMGYSSWTGKSILQSFFIVMIPYISYYAILIFLL